MEAKPVDCFEYLDFIFLLRYLTMAFPRFQHCWGPDSGACFFSSSGFFFFFSFSSRIHIWVFLPTSTERGRNAQNPYTLALLFLCVPFLTGSLALQLLLKTFHLRELNSKDGTCLATRHAQEKHC